MVRLHSRLPSVDRPDAAGCSPRCFVSARQQSMANVTVTLPDGSSRSVPAGTAVHELAGAISPRLGRTALAAWVDDRLVDLGHRLDRDARLRVLTPTTAQQALHAVSALDGAPAGGRRDVALPRRRSAASAPRPTRASSTTSSSSGRSCPRTSSASRPRCASWRSADLPYRAADVEPRRGDAFFARPRRAAEGAADRGEDGRAGHGVLLHDQGSGHLHRLLRGPARAVDGPAQGVQAADHVERVLEGRRAQPADAARLRDGVLVAGRPRGAPAAPRGSEEARPSEAGPGARPLHAARVGARRDLLARQGDDALQHPRATTCATCCSPPATSRSRRRSSTTRRCGRPPGTGSTTARTCSSSSPRASRWASRP